MPNDKLTDAAPSVRSRKADGASGTDDSSAASARPAWRKPQMWLLDFNATAGGQPGNAEWAGYGGS